MTDKTSYTEKCPSCDGNMTAELVRGPYPGEKSPYFIIGWACRDKTKAACGAGIVTKENIKD